MNKLSRLTALLLALIMLLGSVSLAEGGLPIGGSSGLTSDDWADLVDAAEEKLFYTDEGDTGKEITPEAPEQPEKPAFYPYTDIEELTLIQSETAAEASITASGAAILTHEAAGQWQIAIGGVWANLYGETSSTLTVTSAMMNGRISAEIRKALGDKNAETGEYVAYTQTAVVNLIEAAPAMFSVSRDATDMVASDANDGIMTLEMANQENMVIVQVIYRIKDTDQPVADAYIGQIAKGSALNTSLTLPRVTGYLARACTVVPAILVDKNITTFTEQTADTAGSLTINVTQEVSQQDITIYVDYEPAEVTFTVKHMRQKVENDEYELYAEKLLTGKTGEQVGDKLAKTYEGFSAIWYDPTTAIAADGSTVVEIRYNREYYLLTFDLGGGYGVEPIFARYGAAINVSTPQRVGYTFDTWLGAEGEEAVLPATMPLGGANFSAAWIAANTTFIVAYWLENPNDDGYSYWGSYQLNGTTGTTVQGETYKYYPTEVANKLDWYERYYSTYSHADEDVEISGSGSTVVNVYYKRNKYTLKFYYAQKSGTKYYVIGGSTYRFGKNATISDIDDEIQLLAHYMSDYKSERGTVESLPTLNAKGAARGYTLGHDETTVGTVDYEFHYISFDAKYGADISNLWPCNVFNSVTELNPKHESNPWTGTEAYVSAWNGEHHVWYSQNNAGNQTIKGNYNQLDYKLLWSGSFGEPADKTVTYLCFWENGATISWNTPELYRYQIWVPVLQNQDTNGLTTKKLNGVTYYLHATYDTVDDSYPHSQTAPGMVGYNCINGNTNSWDKNNEDLGAGWKGENGGDDNWRWIEIPEEYKDGVRYAYEINWYYARNTYDLEFESYADSHEILNIPFGEDISGYEWLPSEDPNDPDGLPYPSNQEANSLEFVGWYTTSEFIDGTEYDFSTMPAHDVALFAKWELVWHEARFFHTREDMEKYREQMELPEDAEIDEESWVDPTDIYIVQHRKTLPEGDEYWWEVSAPNPEDPNIYPNAELYEFTGWYYLDGGVEKRFDIQTMPIKTDMDIYAKWTSDTPVEFTFKYQDEKGNQLAEDYTGLALPFTPVTMSAKIGTDLTMAPADKDPMRYIPAVSSHTLNIDVDPTKNVFVFTYSLPGTVEYTVQYLAAKTEVIDGKTVLVPDESKDPLWPEKKGETPNAIVTENYMPVLGYMPQVTQLRLIVSTEEENVIQFLYLPNETAEYFNATHIIVDHNKQKTEYFSEKGMKGTIGQLVAVNKQNISGYAFSSAEVVQTSYNDTAQQWETKTVDAENTDGDTVQHILTDGGMHVYLYYTPVLYPVIVRHLKAGTTDTLLSDETIPAAYGSTLNAENFAKVEKINEAPGMDYRVSSYDPLTHTVKVDDGTAPAENVIIIYYEPDVADITISKKITEVEEENAPDLPADEWDDPFTFTVTLKDEDGKALTAVDITLPGEARQTETLTNGVLTFTLQHNQSMTIHDLPVDTKYKVQEQDTGKFKISYSCNAEDTLTMLDVDMIVTNMYPKYAGELIVEKSGLAENESAIVKADVGGVVYYLVLNKTNGYTATISGIKPGTSYNVSEVTNWTWQYSSTISGGSGTITEENATARVVITNTRTTDKWLHDESHVENNFGTGQSTGVNQ